MLTQAMLAAAERSVALAVSRDPLTAKRLSALSGKVICIRSRSPDFTVYLLPDSTGIGLLGPQANLEADCSLDAPATLLARLAVSSERKQVLEDPQCVLSGDTQVLVELQSIIADLRLDGEAELARWLGPVPAHAIGQVLRSAADWGSATRRSLDNAVRDYLTEETRQLVGQCEAQSAAQAVHELRLHLDRLEARVQRLETPDADPLDE